jgi:hypothetical protein
VIDVTWAALLPLVGGRASAASAIVYRVAVSMASLPAGTFWPAAAMAMDQRKCASTPSVDGKPKDRPAELCARIAACDAVVRRHFASEPARVPADVARFLFAGLCGASAPMPAVAAQDVVSVGGSPEAGSSSLLLQLTLGATIAAPFTLRVLVLHWESICAAVDWPLIVDPALDGVHALADAVALRFSRSSPPEASDNDDGGAAGGNGESAETDNNGEAAGTPCLFPDPRVAALVPLCVLDRVAATLSSEPDARVALSGNEARAAIAAYVDQSESCKHAQSKPPQCKHSQSKHSQSKHSPGKHSQGKHSQSKHSQSKHSLARDLDSAIRESKRQRTGT